MEIDLSRQSLAIPIREIHDVGDARRQAMQAAKKLAFDETSAGQVGIVVTELAGNLIKHAGSGTLILRTLAAGKACGLEIVSLDEGPGMDVPRCLQDGYSTAGSPGTGLGAISRLSHFVDIYSYPGKGAAIVTQHWSHPPASETFDVGAICLPVAGERLCGDGWAVKATGLGLDIMVSDGLGHGPIAAQATDAALDMFRLKPDRPSSAVLEAMHGALRPTRGAAVLVGCLDTARNLFSCAGIGNISGYVMTTPKPKGIVSMNGIVGHQVHKIKEFTYDCLENDLLILHSDGLTTHWKLEDFPGLINRSASLIAAVMYRHFRRGKDDATVLVVRRR